MNHERKSVSSVVNEPEPSEFYVLTARGWPRWINESFEKSVFDEWDKQLAPSRELLSRWSSENVTWEQWEAEYIEEVGSERIRRRAVQWADAAREQGKETVVFVCYEGEEERPKCHTWSILDIIENERQSGLGRFP